MEIFLEKLSALYRTTDLLAGIKDRTKTAMDWRDKYNRIAPPALQTGLNNNSSELQTEPSGVNEREQGKGAGDDAISFSNGKNCHDIISLLLTEYAVSPLTAPATKAIQIYDAGFVASEGGLEEIGGTNGSYKATGMKSMWKQMPEEPEPVSLLLPEWQRNGNYEGLTLNGEMPGRTNIAATTIPMDMDNGRTKENKVSTLSEGELWPLKYLSDAGVFSERMAGPVFSNEGGIGLATQDNITNDAATVYIPGMMDVPWTKANSNQANSSIAVPEAMVPKYVADEADRHISVPGIRDGLERDYNIPDAGKAFRTRRPDYTAVGSYSGGTATAGNGGTYWLDGNATDRGTDDYDSRRGVNNELAERGRVVNIHLNKPMIENFSIHTAGTQEGIKDFKYRVEEVLLDILNSANLIH